MNDKLSKVIAEQIKLLGNINNVEITGGANDDALASLVVEIINTMAPPPTSQPKVYERTKTELIEKEKTHEQLMNNTINEILDIIEEITGVCNCSKGSGLSLTALSGSAKGLLSSAAGFASMFAAKKPEENSGEYEEDCKNNAVIVEADDSGEKKECVELGDKKDAAEEAAL
jgi:hypothetical protein